MKIISIGPAYPLRGGIADFNERLTQEFIANGHNASIISYSLQYPNFLFPGKTQFANYPAPKNLSIKTLVNSINPFSWFKVGKQIKNEKPDVLIIHFWMPFFAPALGKIGRIVLKNKITKIITICHNFIPHETKFGDKLLTKYYAKVSETFVGMSESVVSDINKHYPSKTTIQTPHPLYDNFGEAVSKEIACDKLNLDPAKKYILFFGLVRKYKGLDLLLESFAELKDTNINLIVAGEFYDKPEFYNEIISRLKIENRVILKNEFIPQDEVKFYFSTCDIIAQTYHSATQSGITQIAYHFNKPMLVTNVGGLSEIVPHNKVGYVCEKDSTEIANCLETFFNENKYDEFSKHVKIEKEKYSWKTFCEKIL